MKKARWFVLAGCLLSLLAVVPVSAAPVVLTFEGLKNQEQILNYYDGGFGSLGSGPGPSYGIQFGSSALALIDQDSGGTGNFANEPTSKTIAFFLSGGGLVMNVPAGFDTGFSFFYTSATAASVTVYDGLDATGNLLASLPLAAQYNIGCSGDPSGSYCNWTAVGVAFAGIARSVNFAGGADRTGYDNITLNSDVPVVPEPMTMLLMGPGVAAVALRRRTKR